MVPEGRLKVRVSESEKAMSKPRKAHAPIQAAIWELRQRLKLTQRATAKLLQITPVTLSRYETGAQQVSRTIAYRLAELARQHSQENLFEIFAAHTDIITLHGEFSAESSKAEKRVTPRQREVLELLANAKPMIEGTLIELIADWRDLKRDVRPLDPPSRDPAEQRLRLQRYEQIREATDKHLIDLQKQLFRLLPDKGEKDRNGTTEKAR